VRYFVGSELPVRHCFACWCIEAQDVSAGYRGQCVAEHGPRSTRIYTAEDCPRPVATIRAVDHGSVDELLRAYGWHRVDGWQRSDDVPDGHRVATIEWINESAIDVLDHYEADGQGP
jgi:hypothetical protein